MPIAAARSCSPHEIPEVMKKAIVAVEDKRYFDHGGVDVFALAAVLQGGFSRGGSTIPMQLLKNLVFHDLQGRDVLSRLERKGAEVWYAGTSMRRSARRNFWPPISTRSSSADATSSGSTGRAGTTSAKSLRI